MVEDNEHDSYFNTIIIKEAGICNHFRTAFDGADALEYLQNTNNENPKPDLVFLDINMPRMNGFEFLKEFEKLGKDLKSDILIIMLSTSDIPSDIEKALQTKHVKEFLTKPLSFKVLNDILDKYF